MTELSGAICQKGKILLVTSELLTLNTMKQLLEDHLYFVQAAQSGELVLQAAQEFLPDLILLDTLLPYARGLELCQRLKAEESTRNIPVLFVVTSGQPEDKEEIFGVGGTDYITRPFRSEELLARLEIHITMQRLRVELEIERSERMRLSQEYKQLEQTFTEQVKQLTHEQEEALINERSLREQMIYAARLTTMSKMAALFAQELGKPLNTIRQELIYMKKLVQDNPSVTESLEYSLIEIEYLVNKITNLNQICKS